MTQPISSLKRCLTKIPATRTAKSQWHQTKVFLVTPEWDTEKEGAHVTRTKCNNSIMPLSKSGYFTVIVYPNSLTSKRFR